MEDKHFKMIFWYIVGITTAVFVYVFAVTFIIVPETSQRYVDISLGFLLGSLLGAGAAYLLGGAPNLKKTTLKKSDAVTNEEENTTVKQQ